MRAKHRETVTKNMRWDTIMSNGLRWWQVAHGTGKFRQSDGSQRQTRGCDSRWPGRQGGAASRCQLGSYAWPNAREMAVEVVCEVRCRLLGGAPCPSGRPKREVSDATPETAAIREHCFAQKLALGHRHEAFHSVSQQAVPGSVWVRIRATPHLVGCVTRLHRVTQLRIITELIGYLPLGAKQLLVKNVSGGIHIYVSVYGRDATLPCELSRQY